MKSKKFISGLLAGAMVLTTVFTTGWTEAEAAEEDDLVASYSFENGLANDVGKDNDSADTVISKIVDYSGEPVYEEGRSGQAVRLGDYGLKLNKTNLGDNFTVSMWVKPDGVLKENEVIAFLGYNDPEQWWHSPVEHFMAEVRNCASSGRMETGTAPIRRLEKQMWIRTGIR